MKISKYFLFVFAAAALATGCTKDDDFLEEKSWNFDDQGFYNSESEIDMGMNACYAQVQYLLQGQPQGLHSLQIFGLGLDTIDPTGYSNQYASHTYSAADGNTRHWYNELFYLVNYANTVIGVIEEKGDKVIYTKPERRSEMLGEARFFRGFAYMCLAGMYGNVPIIDKRTTAVITGYTPNTRQEVWEFCYEDFKFAAQNLPKIASKPGKVVRAAADHYLAQICLSLGKFDEAVTAASNVIDKKDGDFEIMKTRFGSRAAEAADRYGHSLAEPAGAYWDLFRMGGNQNAPENKEAIWVGQYHQDTWAKGGGGAAWSKIRGWNVFDKAFLSVTVYGNNTNRAATIDTPCAKKGSTFYVFPEMVLMKENPELKAERIRLQALIADSSTSAADKATYTKQLDEVLKKIKDEQTSLGATAISQDLNGDYQYRYRGDNFQRDSLGGNVANVGRYALPSRYVWKGLWDYKGNEDGRDFRGSETMIQRDPYSPSGWKLSEIMAAYYQRAKDYPNEPAFAPRGTDTLSVFPRFWKRSDDKYVGGNQNYDVDHYLIRIAETYLLRAEAYLAKGDKANAAADINVLRDRAAAAHCSASDVDIDYILDERTRELFTEEFRLITLNRLSVNPNCGNYVTSKYPVQDVTTSNTLYERTRMYGLGYEDSDADNKWAQRPGWVKGGAMEKAGISRNISPIHPHNFQYAIPEAVINSNTGCEYPQNPGY